MTEYEARNAVVREAKEWIGTPYISNGMIKGRRGGVDCAMLFIGVFGNLGFIPKEFDPRPYPPEWHVHRNEERYLEHILMFANEVPGPPERIPLPADLITFKISRAFAHGAIITDWPNIIHAVGGDRVLPEDVSKNIIGKRALWTVPHRFFEPKWNLMING